MAEKQLRILCVEDEIDLRENITTILQAEGYTTIEAENGQEAYEKFPNEKPDLVLCDINMPIMDGRTLLGKLNQDYPKQLCETPFLFLTAFGQKEDKIAGIKLGADDYIVKPIDFDILLSTVGSKLYKSSARHQVSQEKLVTLCEKVSNLIPQEIQQPLQNIITLSATLKKETHGSMLDQKYIDYSSRIYLSALKLNSQISKALDKDRIINEATSAEEFIPITALVNEIKQHCADNNVNYQIADDIPAISDKCALIAPSIISYIKQHELAETKNIILSMFLDYKNNLIISISGKTLLPVFSEELESIVDDLSGEFRIQNDGDSNQETHHIISLPHFLLSK